MKGTWWTAEARRPTPAGSHATWRRTTDEHPASPHRQDPRHDNHVPADALCPDRLGAGGRAVRGHRTATVQRFLHPCVGCLPGRSVSARQLGVRPGLPRRHERGIDIHHRPHPRPDHQS